MGHCGIASAVVSCAVLARSKTKISKITKYYNKGTIPIPVKCETTLLQLIMISHTCITHFTGAQSEARRKMQSATEVHMEPDKTKHYIIK